jgi:undecaprenyl-phosphate 4-deoxy-4-formamido-L-arabinose transferase
MADQDTARQAEPPLLSIVVPVYRSEATLGQLHQRVSQSLDAAGISFELIFVEDCGGDGAWSVIESLIAGDPRVKGIQFTRNFGQHAATICGLSRSHGTWAVTLDDDLEHPPEKIPALLEHAAQGHDIVYGIYPTRSHRWWRNLTSRIGKVLFKIAIPSLSDKYTSFRLIRGDIARGITVFDSPFPFVDGYLAWLTNRVGSVEVPHLARQSGASNYNFRKLLAHTFNIFVTFSDLPLRLASWLGIATFLFSLVLIAYVLYGRITGLIEVSGFASIMAALAFFGGIQLLVLGVFGEYLGRMNFKSSRKPLFLVREAAGIWEQR